MLIFISYTLSFILLSLLKKYSFIKNKIIVFFIIYIIIIIVYQSYDSYLIYKLNSFDLDSDGIFGGKEISLGQKLAMDAVMHDTARILIWFTGIIYALLYILFSWLKPKYVIWVILIGVTFLGINSLIINNQGLFLQCKEVRIPSEGTYFTDNKTKYSYKAEEIERICVNWDSIYRSSIYNREVIKNGKVFNQIHTKSSSQDKKMNILVLIYHNSAIFALIQMDTQNIPVIKLGITYISYFVVLLFTIIGIYVILSSNKFFPPIYFNTYDILESNEYGFSGLIILLAGSFFLFPLYCWYFFFIILFLFLMWWIYKKLMLK